MKQATKIFLLAIALLLVAILVTRLKTNSSPSKAPPAEVRVGEQAETRAPGVPGRVTQQPTILRARPPEAEGAAGRQSSPRHWDDRVPLPDGRRPAAETTYPTGRTWIEPGPPETTSPRVPTQAAPASGPGGVRSDQVQPPTANGAPPIDMRPPVENPPASQPTASLQATPAPARTYPEAVLTEADDSLWRISERVYGVGGFYKALYEHNRQRVGRPDRMAAGIQILTPPPAELVRLYPSLCPPEATSTTPRTTARPPAGAIR